MIRIAICDDNGIQLELLYEIVSEYINERMFDATVSRFKDGASLLNDVKLHGFYDLYILDMIMPEVNGLELASTLRMLKDPGKIIFLTSTVEYAVSSYDVKAFYYMLKPLDINKMYQVLDEAVKDIETDESIVIKQKSATVKIKAGDVMYVDLVNRCPCYHLRDGRTLTDRLVRGSFKEAVEPLTVHKEFEFCGISMLINVKYIDAVDSESVLLDDGTLLYPSKSGIAELKKRFKQT